MPQLNCQISITWTSSQQEPLLFDIFEYTNGIPGSANCTEFENMRFPERKVIDFLKSIPRQVTAGRVNYSSSRAQRVMFLRGSPYESRSWMWSGDVHILNSSIREDFIIRTGCVHMESRVPGDIFHYFSYF